MDTETNAETANETEKVDADTAKTEEEETGGAGSKQAVLADLHRERETRRSLQSQVEELSGFRDSITRLLGGEGESPSPEELANTLTGETARADGAEKLLNAVLAAPLGTNVAAMVDSLSFRQGAEKAEDVAQFTKEWIEKNPTFRVGGGVARDMNQGNDAPSGKPKSFDDILRGR